MKLTIELSEQEVRGIKKYQKEVFGETLFLCQVSNNWIEDGFNLQEHKDKIQDQIKDLLPYAYDHEMAVKVKIQDLKPSEGFSRTVYRSLTRLKD